MQHRAAGGHCFSEFDDVFIRQFIECICTS